jgi:hypothetical protein
MPNCKPSNLIREMASALCLAEPKWLVMLNVYCSDSGMAGGPHCFLGGYLANVDQWANYCDQWHILCEKHLQGRPLKITAESEIPYSVLVKFAECIVEHVETEIWVAAPEVYLNRLTDKYGVRFDRYRLCFHGLLERTVMNCHARQISDQLAWAFDLPTGPGDDASTELKLSLMRGFVDAKSLLTSVDKKVLHSITFATYEDVLPLQAARFLVEYRLRLHTTPIDPLFDPICEIFRKAKIRKPPFAPLVWFDHTLEDSLERLRRTDAIKC